MIRPSKLAFSLLALLVPATVFAAKEVWEKKASEWTAEDAQQILAKSPWIQQVNVFPNTLRAEISKPKEIQDRVGVTVRWQSAGVVRHAVTRLKELSGGLTEADKEQLTRPEDRFYMIQIHCCARSKPLAEGDQPDSLDAIEAVPFETLAANTSLEADGMKFPLIHVVKPSQNGGYPEAVFIFERPKGKSIPDTAKTAVFKTKFASAELEAKFKLDKMVWNGKRDLDGDFGNLSEVEKRRREIQTVILGSGDENFTRAVTDVKVEKRAKGQWATYLFYDPNRELSNPAEARSVDVAGRKRAVASALGKWATANKVGLEVIIFVDPTVMKAVDYIIGSDAEKLAKLEGDAAAKFFKEKLQSADQKGGKSGKSSEAPKDAQRVATKTDQDGDGVPNDKDKCQSSAAGAKVDATGCP